MISEASMNIDEAWSRHDGCSCCQPINHITALQAEPPAEIEFSTI